MQELLSFSTHEKDLRLAQEGELGALLRSFSLAGLELLPLSEVPGKLKREVVGVHLPFQPIWLPFWFGDQTYLREVFPGLENLERFFGGKRPEDFVTLVAKWLKEAFSLAPRYIVIHASHCGLEEVFSLRFRYDTKTVLAATAELLNAAFEEAGVSLNGKPLICFENLWWPGLSFYESWEVDFFFLKLALPASNLALALDTGHLLNSFYLLLKQPSLGKGPVPEGQALLLLKKAISSFPPAHRELIRVVHLNFSPRADLFRPYEQGLRQLLAEGDPLKRFSLARERVLGLDPHLPFQEIKLSPLLDLLEPDFLVHEVRFADANDLRSKIAAQRRCLL